MATTKKPAAKAAKPAAKPKTAPKPAEEAPPPGEPIAHPLGAKSAEEDENLPKMPEGQDIALMLNERSIAKVVFATLQAMSVTGGEIEEAASWEELTPEAQAEVMADIGDVMDDTEVTPRGRHDAWCSKKIADGWAAGPQHDEANRTSPLLLHWDNAPALYKLKLVVMRELVIRLGAGPL